jgi:hypothetical protein
MRRQTFFTVLNSILTCVVVWIVVEWFLIMFCYQKGWLLPWIITSVK